MFKDKISELMKKEGISQRELAKKFKLMNLLCQDI